MFVSVINVPGISLPPAHSLLPGEGGRHKLPHWEFVKRKQTVEYSPPSHVLFGICKYLQPAPFLVFSAVMCALGRTPHKENLGYPAAPVTRWRVCLRSPLLLHINPILQFSTKIKMTFCLHLCILDEISINLKVRQAT
jgi:hypothetical protein